MVQLGIRAVPVRRRGHRLEQDFVVIEEPLEIRVNGKPLVVTMRTPGHDEELAAGFLYSESVIKSRQDLSNIRTKTGITTDNLQIKSTLFDGDKVEVELHEATTTLMVEKAQRDFRSTAACGVCGKERIEDLEQELPRITPISFSTELLESLPNTLRREQKLFNQTGGIHAAGLFTPTGKLIYVREDIGRHNAVDKVIGRGVLDGKVPLAGQILVVSGRAGFELVQKALKASIPIMVSVGAASSVAVEMATDAGMALYSFAAPGRGNLHVGISNT